MILSTAALAQDREESSAAEERAAAELEKAAGQVEKLHAMAREAEELGELEEAKKLHLKAREIEQRIHETREDLFRRRIEEGERELKLLRKKAELLEQKGRLEEAEEVRRKARELEAGLHRGARQLGERKMDDAARRVEELLHLAREAAERGDDEEAEHLQQEAVELRERLHDAKAHAKLEAGKEEIHRLLQKAEDLDDAGRHEDADEVRRKAAHLESRLAEFISQQEQRRIAEAEGHIRELLHAAAEAWERGDTKEAEELKREAAELSHEIEKARDRRAFEVKIDAEKERIHALFAKAEHLDREGRHEEADRLRADAEATARELQEYVHAMDEKRLIDVEKRLEHLHALAREAKERGDEEEARELYMEVRELEWKLHNEREHREVMARTEEMNHQRKKLVEALEHARREGNHEKAAKIEEKIAHVEMEMDRLVREMETHEMERKIAFLVTRAEEAREAGRSEEAMKLRKEAQAVERELHEMLSVGESDSEELLLREIAELRREIEFLREEVRQLNGEKARGRGPTHSAEAVIRRVSRAPEIGALLDRLEAGLFVGERFNPKTGVWVLEIRSGERGRVLGRVVATDQGKVKRIELE